LASHRDGDPDEGRVSDDAIVIAVGTLAGATFEGAVRPGLPRAEALLALGPVEDWGAHLHSPSGLSVELRDQAVFRVAVSAP
jgi:hypothetical protein